MPFTSTFSFNVSRIAYLSNEHFRHMCINHNVAFTIAPGNYFAIICFSNNTSKEENKPTTTERGSFRITSYALFSHDYKR